MVLEVRWRSSIPEEESLSVLNRDELLHCLSFLTDDELWDISLTSRFFRDAFFRLTKSSRSYVLKLGTRGYRFGHVEKLKLYNNKTLGRLQDINFQKQYPRLIKITIMSSEFNPIDLCAHEIPQLNSVQYLTLHNCQYLEDTPWPFPKVKMLNIFRSKLSLPKELRIDTLILRSESVITGPIPNTLRELRVYSTQVPKIDPKASNLKRLEIYHPIAYSGYHTYSTRSIHTSLPPLHSLTELKMEIYNPCIILERAQFLFPNLTEVSVERAAFSRLDLALISPHQKLQTLRIHQNRILGLHHITPENFPRLREIGFTGELAELSPLPGNANLTSLIVSSGYSRGLRSIDRVKFPNLKIREKPLECIHGGGEMRSW